MSTPTTTTDTTAIIRGHDEGEATWFLNTLTTKVLGVAETGSAYGITEQWVTAASNPPLHRHAGEDEAFYVLEGEVEVEVDGQVSDRHAPAPSPSCPAVPSTPTGSCPPPPVCW